MSATLQELRGRIEVLPERRRRAERVGKLRRYLEIVEGIVTSLAESNAVHERIRGVFPTVDHARLRKSVDQARVSARRIMGRIAPDPNAGPDLDALERKELDAGITVLRDAAQSAARAVREEWSEETNRVLVRFRKLVDAANTRLTGSEQLTNALGRFEREAQAAPRGPAEVTRVRENIEALSAAVRRLDLEGVAGTFLIQVADSVGDPRLLNEPEVRAFLDKHDLWGTLSVVFR